MASTKSCTIDKKNAAIEDRQPLPDGEQRKYGWCIYYGKKSVLNTEFSLKKPLVLFTIAA